MPSAVFVQTNGFRVLVPVIGPVANVVLQGEDASVDPTADELVGQ